MLENIKIGIPQVIEVGFLFYALTRSFLKNGELMLDEKGRENIEKDEKNLVPTVQGCLAFVMAVFWIGIAYWGGTQGVWLLAYIALTVMFSAYMANMSKETMIKYRFNFMRTLLMQGTFQVILYMGGFYTLTTP